MIPVLMLYRERRQRIPSEQTRGVAILFRVRTRHWEESRSQNQIVAFTLNLFF
jgi:hypothetical protein